jgi:branched-chain amino acid transport system permease protein
MAAATASQLSRAEQWFRNRKAQERKRLIWIAVGTVLAVLYPFLDSATGFNRLGAWIPIFVFVILAMGLNIVVGYAGLLDLGYVAFFVIGAYSNAFLTSPNSYFVQKGWVPGFMQDFWPAMAISWVVAAAFGVLLGAPTLRLRGDYLAIVTLGFGEIVPDFFTNADGVTRGPQGIGQIAQPPTIPLPFGHEFGFNTTDQRNWFWLIVVVVLFSLWLITRLQDSRIGRAWQAIREDEVAAVSMGINLTSTKLWAFALGASFSGFAGSVYAGYVHVVYPDQFQFSVSVIILAMVILGGLGNIYGVIGGALIIGFFDRILANELNKPLHWVGDRSTWGPVSWFGDWASKHDVNTDRFLIFGLALVLVMVLRPGGLFPARQRAAEMAGDDSDAILGNLENDVIEGPDPNLRSLEGRS